MKLKDFNPIKIYNEYVMHENKENNTDTNIVCNNINRI